MVTLTVYEDHRGDQVVDVAPAPHADARGLAEAARMARKALRELEIGGVIR